jgi:uncharacterized protein (DUF111 family)
MSSEVYSYLYDKILEEGALDVYTESIYMKKNRPANKLSILCKKRNLQKFVELMLIETTTFGVRYHQYNRETLTRKFTKLDTPYGLITVKLGYFDGKLIKVTPEYEDCKIIAKKHEISFNQLLYEINYMINEKFDINLLT